MQIKINYFIIPLITIFVSVFGGWLTSSSVNTWYKTLKLPSIAPAGSFIGLVWTIIFILSAISALLFWNGYKGNNFKLIVVFFLLNAGLNILWSFLFFRLHLIGWSIVEMVLLNLTNLVLIILLWKALLASAILLIPYFVWVSFATYLAYTIWTLNR